MNKSIHVTLWLCCLSLISFSQPYGNEWINFDQSYHKFTVTADGLYRLPYSTLSTYFEDEELIGADFQLYGRGREVAIYVSTDGQFGSSDYIEFYARKNDGELDAPLFKTGEHLHTKYSMYNDAAAYFLSLAPGNDNFRLETTVNSPAGLPVEPYFWFNSEAFYTNEWNSGQPIAGGTLLVLRDSHFGRGEGYTGSTFNGPATRNRTLNTPSKYTGDNSLQAILRHVHVTKSFTGSHQSILTVGSAAFTYDYFGFGVRKIEEAIALSNIGASTTTVAYRENNAVPATDAYVALEYPRLFNFGSATIFPFTVRTRTATQLQISAFNASGSTPVLYDLANGQRYVAQVSGSRYDFGLTAVSADRDLVLVGQSASAYTSISTLSPVTFTDYSQVDAQGDYIILSHRKLKESADSIDYVTEYRDYRRSLEGGSYEAEIAWITDIENQFGWGVRNHPLAIRNFINYMADNFAEAPGHMFIIGKGITYTSIRTNATNFTNCLIVSMGEPDSDLYLTARNPNNEIPQIAIGRLSASTGDNVGMYLSKMMVYEGTQNDTSDFAQNVADKQWMKRLLHLGGGKNATEQSQFKLYLNAYRTIAENPFFGGVVHSVFKTSTDPIQISTSELVDSLIDNGISLITFFGHSSTSTIDFDITPEEFENDGKFHVFLSNGCFVGSIFGSSTNTYSDRFIFQDNKGSIAYIAPITLAVPSSLNYYSSGFYTRFANTMYGRTLGEIMQDVSTFLINTYGTLEDLLAKQMILHGDPALRINSPNRPDYVITQKSISYNPEIVSASRDSFDVRIAVTNIGRAVNQNYTVNIQRNFPGGSLADYQKILPTPEFRDTVVIRIPTDRLNGLGTNILRIKVDYGDEISEMSEMNNEVVDTLIIFSDDILPVLPYNFCIQNVTPEKIYFSTASYNETPSNYILQIDTTEYFNSPLLQVQNVNSRGGIVEWSPSIPYLENTVYYVRSALDSLIDGTYNWNGSSFLYSTELGTGWNQSHYFQFKKDDFFTLQLEEPNRRFEFSDEIRELRLIDGVMPNPLPIQSQKSFLDGNILNTGTFSRSSFGIFVFDESSGKYLESNSSTTSVVPCVVGTYGSHHPCEFTFPRPIISFFVNDLFWRYQVIQFIENDIPDGAYVLLFTMQETGATMRINTWAADLNYPEFFDRSLFEVLEQELNSTKIRQIQDYNPYVLFTQKGNPDFETIEFHKGRFDIIDTTFTFEGAWNSGALRSTRIGPSNGWNSLEIDWNSLDDPSYDDVKFNVYGVNANQSTDLIYENVTDTSLSLASVDVEVYRQLQLEMFARDDSSRTAPQLKSWRVLYDKVPEAAVDPQLRYFISADTIDIGLAASLEVGVTNISSLPMDSLLVKVSLNKVGATAVSYFKRFGPLPARESRILELDLNQDFVTGTGAYVVLVEINPNNDQPEQFHFNNYATFSIYVNDDRINPLLDVTFDGVHILDGDIISPRPEIIVKLKDENTGLALSDTSSIEMFLYYPDAPEVPVRVDPNAENVTFVPADPANLTEKNEAFIYFYPNFEQDGIYRLKVQGKDARDNDAGDYDYIVSFEVINESSISHFLNYPNPFSTSTRFVFTLTGAEIPQDIKIQILTVSGRVVREITRDEIGPINIGRNITEFAWDGTDRYGDQLANGLYIYKVITRLNGETLKQYTTSADRFFGKEGFGKMYLIR